MSNKKNKKNTIKKNEVKKKDNVSLILIWNKILTVLLILCAIIIVGLVSYINGENRKNLDDVIITNIN